MSGESPRALDMSGVEGARIGVLATRWNRSVVDRLLEGALNALPEHLRARAMTRHVPGAFELPQAALHMIEWADCDAVVALGAIVRGETPHFDFICAECARGLGSVARRTGLPVAFGVLTANDMEQAMERAGGSHGNKGEEAMQAALEMVSFYGLSVIKRKRDLFQARNAFYSASAPPLRVY